MEGQGEGRKGRGVQGKGCRVGGRKGVRGQCGEAMLRLSRSGFDEGVKTTTRNKQGKEETRLCMGIICVQPSTV